MSKKCAKCTKTVYPTEELKCLDKIWHKACFRCEVCGMTLNMKNYKGYDKLPYCNAHYPTTKHTQVADTPETRRIAENTKIQSQIQYHEDFEKSKGKISQVADTVEMQRHVENTRNFSSLNYHRDFEKSKDKFTAVADPVLLKSQMKMTKTVSLHDYHKDFEKSKDKYTAVADPVLLRRQMETSKNFSLKEYHNDYEHSKWKYTPVADPADMKRHLHNKKMTSVVEYKKDFERDKSKYTAVPDTVEMRTHQKNKVNRGSVQYHADFEKQKGHKTSVAEDPETARIKQNTAIQSNINYWGVREQRSAMEERRPHEIVDELGGRRRNPGKISDYDPGAQQQFNSPYSGKTQANIVYDSHSGEGRRSYTEDRRSYTDDRRSYTEDRRSYTDDRRSYTDDRRSYTEDRRSYTDRDDFTNPGRRQPGSISDYDPMNENFGSMTVDPRQAGYQAHPEPVRQPPPPQQQSYQPPPAQTAQAPKSKGMMCKAMYDYSAADSDEVSFADGDIIIECQPVDAGWMTGRVERTGQYGMLPSNYVERIN